MRDDAAITKRITFARHAESLSNARNRLSTKPPGQPVSPLGVQQARALGESLRGSGIEVVLHSPMLRARQTAEIVASALGADITVDSSEDLLELDAGVLEGRHAGEAMSILAEPWARWTVDDDLDVRSAEGGETAREVLQRFDRVIASNLPARSLVVSHGGFLQLSVPNRSTNLHNRHGVVNWLRNCQTVEASVLGNGRLVCDRWAGHAADEWTEGKLVEVSVE
ncbi:histidine phosphatase family protein [Leifsonia sp. McL0607]|uniref:histidine phosphatase family protein n=1 Tax=Leifsonia sp. McL0607 TaxID=3415672 RepID=UPI003CF8A58E